MRLRSICFAMSAMARAKMSEPPPGPVCTTTSMGFAGLNDCAASGAAAAAAAEDPLRDDLRADIDGLARAQRRAAADSDAEAKLEALKRRMGK